jgi:hypothetical protein
MGITLARQNRKRKLKKRRKRLSPRAVGRASQSSTSTEYPLGRARTEGKNKKDDILRFRCENQSELSYCTNIQVFL